VYLSLRSSGRRMRAFRKTVWRRSRAAGPLALGNISYDADEVLGEAIVRSIAGPRWCPPHSDVGHVIEA
jgi:hypothetical protein